MEIYLMQHGLALPKEEDPEEGLSPEGDELIHASGKALSKMGIGFDAILASTKKRARQTAAIVAEEVAFPVGNIIETDKVKAKTPPEETIQVLAELSGCTKVLIAGHLPSLAEVTSFFLTGGSKAAVIFENGGCCRIDVEELPTHSGKLRWYVTPEQLKLIASSGS
ncbi:MAG: SixA phosphatase family protein [Thermodesulfobacteriota bacterium]